jgi:2-polyprenyl-3-methyl-5-hydroxy-6-metoxy-1,4-benzoquinol methylase
MEVHGVKRVERFWDSRSKEYDRNEEEYERSHKQAVDNTRKHLSVSDIVLDYGCGTGIVTNDLADSVREIHGVDISSEMIDVARRKAAERGIENVHYAQATIFHERYGTESYNVILAFSVLHLLEDTQMVMQRIHELLKPGGLFISETPCLGERTAFFSILLFLLSKTGLVPYLSRFRTSELQDLVVGGGFRIVDAEDSDQTPPTHFIVAQKVGGTH